RNFDSGKTYQLEKKLVIKPHAYRQEVVFKFIAPEAGEYHSAPGIFIQERIHEWTDCWSWSENPLFFVMSEHRVIEFAGYKWDVKAGFGNPGGNFWSGDSSDIWVDEKGRLHLTLSAKDDRWYATEVISRDYFGYGTYTFYIDADLGLFDSHVVAGIFLYLNEENEIDIEFSRWGDDDNYQFGNYVVQPAELPGNQFRFPIMTNGSFTTHQITWMPGQIQFISWHGHYPEPLEDRIIAQWQYSGDNVPVNNGLRLFFNLWLFRGIAPSKPGKEKLVITDMNYKPASLIDLNGTDDQSEQNQDVDRKP
ncbi:MAG: glycoside hydrolase family 16 protein, partial [Bacteroidota bacterium]